MHHPLIVLADRARARFFTLRRIDVDGTEKTELVEEEDMVCPEQQLRDEEVYTSSKSGLRFPRTIRGSHTTTFDEHRDSHRREVELRFARSIADRLTKLLDATHTDGVILASAPRALGLLRPVLEPTLDLVEVPKELTHLPAREVQRILAGQGLVATEARPPVPRS